MGDVRIFNSGSPARRNRQSIGRPTTHVLCYCRSRSLSGGEFYHVSTYWRGSDHNWLRARTASEALKREAYKYAVSVKPYDDPLKRDAALNSERERIERDVDDLLPSAVSSAKAGSAPQGKLSRGEYVAARVREQIDRFYLPRANANKHIGVTLRWVEFTLALAATIITAMVGVAGKELFGIKFDFVVLTAVLTTIAGAVLAHIEATRCDFLVMIYRATARRLSAETSIVGDVNALSAEQWSDFVNRCETIISDENTSWAAKWTKP
jgi:SMODS and SLOG-associating 2TM effector domain 1/Protein of unknown function (DUF4231)